MTKSTSQLAREARRNSEEVEYLHNGRPKVRGDCIAGPRPCPWVGCRYHLYLDVNPENGSIKFNFPHIDPMELEVSCSLDVTDEEGTTLDEVGAYMNLSRERIRQVEVQTVKKMKPLIESLVQDKARKNGR